MFTLLFDSIIRRMKSFCFSICLCIVAIVLFAFVVYIYEDSIYCVNNADKILREGIDGTGVIGIINFSSDLNEEIRRFRNEVYELEEVNAIGTSLQPGYMYLGLDELSDIQSKYIDMKDNTSQSVMGILVENTALSLCDLQLESGEFIYDKAQEANCTYLYLGNNLKDIPVGTEYTVEIGSGENFEKCRFVVKGILKKGARFINGNLFMGNGDFLAESCYTNLDNMVLALEDDSSINFWMYSINEGTDFDAVEAKINDIADKYGVQIYYGRASNITNERITATKELNNAIIKLLGIVLLVSIVIMVCVQITAIFNNVSEYGILYANGYSMRQLCVMQILENALKMTISLIAAIFIAKKLLLFSFFGMSDLTTVFYDIYYNYVIIKMIAVSILIVILDSIVPVIVLRKYKPIELIGGNDT